MTRWAAVAQRAVRGLGVEASELVQVRDHAGRCDVLAEVLLASGLVGAATSGDE